MGGAPDGCAQPSEQGGASDSSAYEIKETTPRPSLRAELAGRVLDFRGAPLDSGRVTLEGGVGNLAYWAGPVYSDSTGAFVITVNGYGPGSVAAWDSVIMQPRSARVTYMIQSFKRSYGFAKVVDTVTLSFTRLREPVERTRIPDVRLR